MTSRRSERLAARVEAAVYEALLHDSGYSRETDYKMQFWGLRLPRLSDRERDLLTLFEAPGGAWRARIDRMLELAHAIRSEKGYDAPVLRYLRGDIDRADLREME